MLSSELADFERDLLMESNHQEKIVVIHVDSDSFFDPQKGGTCKVSTKNLPYPAEKDGNSLVFPCFPMREPFNENFKWCNPVQTVFLKAMEEFNPRRIVVATPTSSGKSIIAYFFMEGFSGIKVYVSPQKAIASEKYAEMLSHFGSSRVEIRTGDYIPEDRNRDPKEHLVCTYEYFALATRNDSSWLKDVGCVVLDEVHVLHAGRFAVDEVLWACLERDYPLLCLSATIPRLNDFARHVKADLVIQSSWRPVPLERDFIPFFELSPGCTSSVSKKARNENTARTLVQYVFDLFSGSENTLTLVFVPSKDLGWITLRVMNEKGARVYNTEVPFVPEEVNHAPLTVAFHCADLSKEERESIEKAFKSGEINVLLATHTLAYGVNLPAERVVVLVNNRMMKKLGDVDLFPTIVDCVQMEGRAGRLGYSRFGEVHYLIKNKGRNGESYTKAREKLETRNLNVVIEPDNDQADFYVMIAIARNVPLSSIAKYSYVFRDFTRLRFLQERKQFLERFSFVDTREKKVTKTGKFCLSFGVPPQYFLEFLLRYLVLKKFIPGKEAKELYPLVVSPLHQKQQLESSQSFTSLSSCKNLMEYIRRMQLALKHSSHFLSSEYSKTHLGRLHELYERFAYHLSRNTPSDLTQSQVVKNRSGMLDVLGYVTGTWFLLGVDKPFGNYGWLKHHCYYLARLLCYLKKKKMIDWTYDEILRTLHSLSYGIPPSMAYVGGISGIGHVRGSVIAHVLAVNDVFERVTFEMKARDLLDFLSNVKRVKPELVAMIHVESRAIRSGKTLSQKEVENQARDVIKNVQTILQKNREERLVDVDLLKWLVSFIYENEPPQKIMGMKKEELIDLFLNVAYK